jgi:hypothetical protein
VIRFHVQDEVHGSCRISKSQSTKIPKNPNAWSPIWDFVAWRFLAFGGLAFWIFRGNWSHFESDLE